MLAAVEWEEMDFLGRPRVDRQTAGAWEHAEEAKFLAVGRVPQPGTQTTS
jgi:hypothetical protein